MAKKWPHSGVVYILDMLIEKTIKNSCLKPYSLEPWIWYEASSNGTLPSCGSVTKNIDPPRVKVGSYVLH